MKILVSILGAFFIGIMTVNATSVEESVTITQKLAMTSQKAVQLNWSTLKCVQYGGPAKTYLIKGVDGVSYKIKDKNWNCAANADNFNYNVKQCECKQLYPATSSGGDNDSKGRPVCPRGGCGTDDDDDGGGTTDGGTTDGGETDAGTTDGGTTDAGTTDGGTTDAGTTDGGSTDAGATDGGATDAGTINGATDAGTLNGDQ